ncbi:MAG: enoyl-CoA hydratase-related protein [Sagittula sp.]|uniref:enoyl-CoA hydratase-related protein n=1 Tax=Sagittula sp. TaxID=2038081 RepID=UPI004057E72D
MPHVHFDTDGPVATITIDRPDRMNALHPAAQDEMDAAWDRVERTEGLRVVILTGAGDRAFCAGYDLRDNLETGVMHVPETGFGGLTRRRLSVPVIAAVNGVALGGGFEMALACDIILASENARFGLPEPRVGWAALSGGVQRLPAAIGEKRAMDMILTGRTVDAAEADRLGLVSAVVAPDALMAAARGKADEIAACAPLAIRASREVAYRAVDLDVERHDIVRRMLDSQDAREGKAAFAARRPPVFTGC